MAEKYVQRMVNLQVSDYRAIKECAEEYGLGSRGFSAALRLIIREWVFYHRILHLNLETQPARLVLQTPDQPEEEA